MKISMLIGAATLALATPSIAQQMAQPPAPNEAPPPPNDMSSQQMPQSGQMSPSNPNPGQQTGTPPGNPGMMSADPGAPGNPGAPVGPASGAMTMGGSATRAPAPRADYPVCSRTVQDSCINASDARKAKRPR